MKYDKKKSTMTNDNDTIGGGKVAPPPQGEEAKCKIKERVTNTNMKDFGQCRAVLNGVRCSKTIIAPDCTLHQKANFVRGVMDDGTMSTL